VGIVFSSFTTSLDGFIADANGQVGHLFDWYDYADVEVPLRGYGLTFHMSQASADYWHQNDTEGAFIAGRGIFDDARGWRESARRLTDDRRHPPPTAGGPAADPRCALHLCRRSRRRAAYRRDAVNSRIGHRFDRTNVDRTVVALVASQGGGAERIGHEVAKKRLTDRTSEDLRKSGLTPRRGYAGSRQPSRRASTRPRWSM
jgi:hypothetical protein